MKLLQSWNARLDGLLKKADTSLERTFSKLSGEPDKDRDKDKDKDKDKDSQEASAERQVKRRMPVSLLACKRTLARECWLFLLIFFIWFMCQCGLGFGGLLIVCSFVAGKKVLDQVRRERLSSLHSAYSVGSKHSESAHNEFLARLGDVPSWVFFADWERAEWLNTVIQRLWPYLNKFVTKFILNNFSDMLKKQTPLALEFCKVDIGDEPLRIGSIRSYNVPNMARDEIIFDMEVLYCGDAEFKVNARALRVGVCDFKLRGTIRVTLKPLLSNIPFVSCITVAFISRPEIDFNLTDVADIIDKLGLHHAILAAVNAVVDSMIVLPNRLPIRLSSTGSLNEAYLKHPMPLGVLRVTVIEAKKLPRTDFAIGKMSKCDGFCEISVGNQFERTRAIQDQSNPRWNESFDFTIVEKHGQRVEIGVFDEDSFNRKQKVGQLHIDSNDIANAANNCVDKWYHIYNTTNAKLHLKLQYFNLSDNAANLNDAVRVAPAPPLTRPVSLPANQDDETVHAEHTALLYIYLDSARNLPRSARNAEPDAKVVITVEKNRLETEAVKGCNPKWSEVFHCLVDDPQEAVIYLEIVDKKMRRTLANSHVKLKHIESEPRMIWAKPIHLQHNVTSSATETNLYATIVMRAMTSQKIDVAGVACYTDHFFLHGCTHQTEDSAAQPPQSSAPILAPIPSLVEDSVKRASTSNRTGLSRSSTFSAGFGQSLRSTGKSALEAPAHAALAEALEDVDEDVSLAETDPDSSLMIDNQLLMSIRPSRPAQLTDEEVDLKDAGAHGIGKVKLSLHYIPQKATLTVVVHRCLNLCPTDIDKNSLDSYVSVRIIAGSSKRRQRTRTEKRSANPMFNASLTLPLTHADMLRAYVLVKVKNAHSSIFSKRKNIGVIVLRIQDFMLEEVSATAWFDLQLQKL